MTLQLRFTDILVMKFQVSSETGDAENVYRDLIVKVLTQNMKKCQE